MKNKIALCISLVALAGLLGCRVPTVEYHVGLHQKKVQALQHWDLMAKEVVDKATADPRFAGKAIAVNETANATVFLNTFNQLIKTELLNRKALSVDGSAAAPSLEVKTQLLRHRGKVNSFVPNPASLPAWIISLPIDLIAGGVFGELHEANVELRSELLVISLIREGGVPQMGVKQIVYVHRDEAAAFYLRPARFVSTYEPVSPVKVTTEP
jgi:hypothetical protein